MSQSKMGSKLANSLRKARDKPDSSSNASASNPADKTSPQSGNTTDRGKSTVPARRKPDTGQQSPRDNLDQPWENLYPDRIWPD